MAPQKRTMRNKRWIKVGKVALVKAHPNISVGARLVSQTPSTTVGSARKLCFILPKTQEHPNSHLHVMQAPIQLSNQEMENKYKNQEIPEELRQLMDAFDKKALAVNYLLQEQQAILSQINKYWENYLANSELHA